MRLAAKGADPALGKKLAAALVRARRCEQERKVTEPEAQALLAATFRRYDANGDGKIGGARAGSGEEGDRKGR